MSDRGNGILIFFLGSVWNYLLDNWAVTWVLLCRQVTAVDGCGGIRGLAQRTFCARCSTYGNAGGNYRGEKDEARRKYDRDQYDHDAICSAPIGYGNDPENKRNQEYWAANQPHSESEYGNERQGTGENDKYPSRDGSAVRSPVGMRIRLVHGIPVWQSWASWQSQAIASL